MPGHSVNYLVDFPPVDVRFTGRVDFLARLTELVEKARDEKVGVVDKLIVIKGNSGVGKSVVARQLSKNYHSSHPSDVVLWVNAESPESIANSFLRISKHFHIPIHVSLPGGSGGGDENMDAVVESSTTQTEDENDIMKTFPLTDENITNLLEKVYSWFAVEKKQKVLYIMDQGDYPFLMDFLPLSFLPPPTTEEVNSPIVVITSSPGEKNWELFDPVAGSVPLPSLELTNFNEEESREYLQKSLSHLYSDDGETEKVLVEKLINQLGHQLQGFPLALSLALNDISDRYRKLPPSSASASSSSLSNVLQSYLEEFHNNIKNPDILRNVDESNDKVLVAVWENWIGTFKNEEGPSEKSVIEILNLIAFLPGDCLSVEFCHFFHADTKLTHKILRQFKIEDAVSVRAALSILERYSMVSIQELNPSNSTDHLAFNSFVPKYEIRVHQLAKPYTNSLFSFTAHDRHLFPVEDETDFLLKFVTYVEKNYSFFNFSVFHDSLVETITMKPIENENENGQQQSKRPKNKKNPSIYKHYTFFAISLIREAREEAYSMLQKIYQFFQQHCDEETLEYFHLCKIALVYTHHEFIGNFEYDYHQFGRSKSYQFFEMLDNSSVFPEEPSDPLYKLQFKEFVDLVLDLATKYIENQLIQKVAADILLPSSRMIATMGPMVDDSTIDEVESQNRKVKIGTWIKKYHEKIQSKDLEVNFHSWRTAATVFQIAKVSQIADADELTKKLLIVIEAHIDNIDDFNIWEYLYETTRFWDSWVTRPWESFENWATDDLNEASRIKKNWLDWGGLNFLIRGLVWIPENHLEDFQHTIYHFLEIIRDLAYFEDCRLTMLNSLQFMKALSHVYSSSHESTAKYKCSENLERHIKVMVAVILAFFAILSGSDSDNEAVDVTEFASKFSFIIDNVRLFDSEFGSISLKSLGCSSSLDRIIKYCSGSREILAHYLQSKTANEPSLSPVTELAAKFHQMLNV